MSLRFKDIELKLGRDSGKKVRVTEMPLMKGDRWARRVLIMIAGGQIKASDINIEALSNINTFGVMVEIARLGWSLLQQLSAHEDRALELIDELLECASLITSSGETRPILTDDLQEIASLFVIRKEAFMLHIDPLKQGLIQTSESSQD